MTALMDIIFSDDEKRLTPEIVDLMKSAGNAAMMLEFGNDVSPAEVSVTVVSGDEIRELNRDYRRIDRVTDVLSFPQYADREELAEALSGDGAVLAGDVVLCYDRAAEQAEEYGTGLKRELVYLFVHSIFHLFGYDHETESERRSMREREEQAIRDAGI
jgi:probable rRNA maturation factor